MTDPQTIASKLTKAQADRVSMPIGPGAAITCERFWMDADHEQQAQWNHGQSLARLAERGGLDWCEAAAIVLNREWCPMRADRAEQIVRTHLEKEPKK
jgi:hypothetical protein